MWGAKGCAESVVYYGKFLQTRPGDFGFSQRVSLEIGKRISAQEYLQAQQLHTVVQQDFLRAFQKVDLIVAPTSYKTARAPEEDAKLSRPHPRRPFSLTGGPSISVPCGFSDEGLPIGLQLAGRPWEDATVLRAAWVYKQAHPLGRRPDLSGPLHGPPLTMPSPQIDIGEAVQSRLESVRRNLAEAVAEVNLDGVAPAVRFRP